MIKLISMAHYGIIWSKIYLYLIGLDVNSNNVNEVYDHFGLIAAL